jgi:hypothetical protein
LASRVDVTRQEVSTAVALLGSIFFGWFAAGAYGLYWCDSSEGSQCARQLFTISFGLAVGVAAGTVAAALWFTPVRRIASVMAGALAGSLVGLGVALLLSDA